MADISWEQIAALELSFFGLNSAEAHLLLPKYSCLICSCVTDFIAKILRPDSSALRPEGSHERSRTGHTIGLSP
jgi:hypothetical protein